MQDSSSTSTINSTGSRSSQTGSMLMRGNTRDNIGDGTWSDIFDENGDVLSVKWSNLSSSKSSKRSSMQQDSSHPSTWTSQRSSYEAEDLFHAPATIPEDPEQLIPRRGGVLAHGATENTEKRGSMGAWEEWRVFFPIEILDTFAQAYSSLPEQDGGRLVILLNWVRFSQVSLVCQRVWWKRSRKMRI